MVAWILYAPLLTGRISSGIAYEQLFGNGSEMFT